jgi:hypothetical protein
MASCRKVKYPNLQKATGLDHKMVFLRLDYLQAPQLLSNILPCSHLKHTKSNGKHV